MDLGGVPSSGIQSVDALFKLSQEIAAKDDGKIPKLYLRVMGEGEDRQASFEKKTIGKRIEILFKKDKSSYKLLDKDGRQGSVSFIKERFKGAFKDILGQEALKNPEGGKSEDVNRFNIAAASFSIFFRAIRNQGIELSAVDIAKDAAKEFLMDRGVKEDQQKTIDLAGTVDEVINAVRKLMFPKKLEQVSLDHIENRKRVQKYNEESLDSITKALEEFEELTRVGKSNKAASIERGQEPPNVIGSKLDHFPDEWRRQYEEQNQGNIQGFLKDKITSISDQYGDENFVSVELAGYDVNNMTDEQIDNLKKYEDEFPALQQRTEQRKAVEELFQGHPLFDNLSGQDMPLDTASKLKAEYNQKWDEIRGLWQQQQQIVENVVKREKILGKYGLSGGLEGEPLLPQPRSMDGLADLHTRVEERLAADKKRLERLQEEETAVIAQRQNALAAICTEWGIVPMVIQSLEEIEAAEQRATNEILEKAQAEFAVLKEGWSGSSVEKHIQEVLDQQTPSLEEVKELYQTIQAYAGVREQYLKGLGEVQRREERVRELNEEIKRLEQNLQRHGLAVSEWKDRGGDELTQLELRLEQVQQETEKWLVDWKSHCRGILSVLSEVAKTLPPELSGKIDGATSFDALAAVVLQLPENLLKGFSKYQEGVEESLDESLKLKGQELKQGLLQEGGLSVDEIKGWLIDEQQYEGKVAAHLELVQQQAQIKEAEEKGKVIAQLKSELKKYRVLLQHIDLKNKKAVIKKLQNALKSNDEERLKIELQRCQEIMRIVSEQIPKRCFKVGLEFPTTDNKLLGEGGVEDITSAFVFIKKFVGEFRGLDRDGRTAIKKLAQEVLNDVCAGRCTTDDAIEKMDDIVSDAVEQRGRRERARRWDERKESAQSMTCLREVLQVGRALNIPETSQEMSIQLGQYIPKGPELQHMMEKKAQEVSKKVEGRLADFMDVDSLIFQDSLQSENFFVKADLLDKLMRLKTEFGERQGRDLERYRAIVQDFCDNKISFKTALKKIKKLPGLKEV